MKKYVEHFLLLVLILVLACIEKTASSSVSVAPLPARDFRKFVHDRQGKLDGLVCSLYGFTHSSRSKPVRDIIIEKVQSIQNENGRIVYLVDSHAGDNCVTSNLFVAYLDRKEGSAALEHLLVKMQSIIDMSRRNHIAPQFILIYRDENFYEEEVNSLLNGNADTDVKVNFVTLDVSNEELESTLESALGKISSMPLSKVHFSHEETSPTPKLSANVEEIEEFNAIYNEVTGVFTFEMGQLGEQVNLNQTVNDLEEVVTEFSDLITSQLQSRPVFSELLLNRIQVLVDTELSSLLGRITMAHQEALIDLFTKRLSKISPTSFRSNARILLKQVVKRHEEFKSNAVKEFDRVRMMKCLSTYIPTTSKLHGRSVISPITTNINELRRVLSQMLREREDFMVVQGLINPFVRQLPFPPTHINFNYLVDPRALYAMREYNSLYDEHRDSYTLNRADPLEFKGVASSPFDPNLRPTPKEKMDPWWVVVKDFFLSDDN